MSNLENTIRELLSTISFQDKNLIDAEIIQYFELDKDEAYLTIVVDSATEQERKELGQQITQVLKTLEEINQVKINFQKPQEETNASSPKQSAQQPRRTAYLQNYKYVVLVSSGKGGVGKSTLSLNLALALKKLGNSVSMLDADVYGPSLPLMMGKRGQKLKTVGNQIMPMSQFEIEFISIGNMVSEGESVVWRGPMVHQALEQLIRDTAWPGGDYMIIDMPPGTGDIAISLAQMTEAVGSVVVCTPQDVALIDARRALAMFEKVDIPVIGMVENMSGFICPDCKKEYPIFGKGGTEKDSQNFQVEFLGSIPIDLNIRLGSDQGKPVVEDETKPEIAKYYLDIAQKLEQELANYS